MAAMFWNMIYGQSQTDSRDFSSFIQKDDLESILKSDRIKQELSNGSSQVTQYLAKPETISKMIDILYDPSQDPVRHQLNTTVNDIFMQDNAVILDSIASSPVFIEKIFQVLLPYNEEAMRKCTTDELPQLLPELRRVPLVCAENFCRLVFTLIKAQPRFQKVLHFLSQHLEIMTWFVYSIQSAAITETLHYIFKIDKNPDTMELQSKIILQSQFVERLYSLFTSGGIFEELVHVAFIFQSFLTTEIKADVKKCIMQNLASIADAVLTPTANPSLIRNIYTIIAITLKQAVKMGILSETQEESQYFSDIVRLIIHAVVPKFAGYLQMDMVAGQVTPSNLYVTHTCTVISEILKIQEATCDFIREKEQLLLNHAYGPENAIAYLTQYYKMNCQDAPLPFVVGFSYIFQDVYVHLYETTKFKFDQGFVKQVTQIHQSSNKQVGTIHLFGPNRELCMGTVEYIIQCLIEAGVIQLVIDQAYKNTEAGIMHFDTQQILAIIAEYSKFSIDFVGKVINDELFAKLKAGVLNVSSFIRPVSMEKIVVNGKEVKGIDQRAMTTPEFNAIKERINFQTKRVSLDALVANLIKKIAIAGVVINGDAAFLAQVYEVKEALGM
ncbi:Conserved_hypothetical protein [Hexamita inflata]|uniref:Uncharacterized protein n=1 Tax=Hexamita inflata TaxID=28002 RepID=A0AA86UWP1_9EUKA|nr:Conserved hypothetical protein [Hexamita inflata]